MARRGDDDYLNAMYPEPMRGSRPRSDARLVPNEVLAEPLDLAEPESVPYTRFPLEFLPQAMNDFALEVAASYEVEPELVALPALVCASAAIGNSRRIRVRSDWMESAMLWAAVVGRPGSLKTPALMAAATPLRDRERDLDEAFERELEKHTRELEAYEKATKAKVTETVERPVEPTHWRQYVDDLTVEELIWILRDNPRGVLMLQDEMSGWVASFNQYKGGGRGGDRGKWLKFWSGVETSVDRREHHGRPVRAWMPFVSVVGGIQPDLLKVFRPEDGADDGFIDRILFAWPLHRVRRWTDRGVSELTRAAYDRMFQYLFALHLDIDDKQRLRARVVDLSSEARDYWVERYNEHHIQMDSPGFDSRLHGAYAKLDGYAARLSLVLYECRVAAGETESEAVDLESAMAAWELIDYFRQGARLTYGHLTETQEDRRVEQVIDAMDRREDMQITLRDMVHDHVAGIKKADDAKALMRSMEQRGYGRVKQGPRGSIVFLRQRATSFGKAAAT